MYLTRGAASLLVERRYEEFLNKTTATEADSDDVLIPLALERGKKLIELRQEDLAQDRFGSELLRKTGSSVRDLTNGVVAH
jgi:hypothetical protein